MSPLFETSHRALVHLLHPGLPAAATEPVVTLHDRLIRFEATAGRVHREAPLPEAVKTLRAQIEAVDQSLLKTLATAGYLLATPIVRVRSPQHTSRTHGNASRRVIQRITLSVDDTGRVRPLVPEAANLRAVHASLSKEAWAERPSQDTWAHWATLFHEAAHSVFNLIPRPFVTDRLPAETTEDINAFLVGPLANAKGFYHRLLSESFADVYSVMMLHQLAPHEPGLDQEVANVQWVRRLMREQVFDPQLSQGRLMFTWGTQTDMALERALNQRAAWQHLAPAELIQEACRHASEGVLAFLAPGRPLGPEKVPLKDNLVRYLQREFNEFLTDHHLIDMAGRAAFEASAPSRSRLRAWRHAYPDHTALRLLDRILGKLNPDQRPFTELYPTVKPEDRYGLVAQFVDKGIRTHGGIFRAELKERSKAVAEHILAAADHFLIPPPAPSETTVERRRRRRP